MTEPLGEALHSTYTISPESGVRPGRTREKSLAECVRSAVKCYLADRGEHEPDDLYRFVVAEVERPLIEETMRWVDGNQSRCAAVLGISRGTLRKKLKEFGLL
ncbi:MAG: helix-turn-helix domain-containing protein [Xanthomonadales bacterium]|nr:helix-turn-helix domain-containing protein [Xanthomonadales bacterium]